ncbi:phosphotransferase family protein [Streptomyces sp. NPDC091387]|uniref:phosphotransferase family protein n=1 Tax=Streptomyces sp. NPDC091387 TaxID=3365998 RepID=UPI00381340F1
MGNTVRRPAGPSSPFTADLLEPLNRQGFTGAPRHLGDDAAGRDVLSYLPGWLPSRFQRWTHRQVAAAGSLVRDLHDATRGSALAGAHPVVCHHDPGPDNTVFREGRPVAFIDFDTAAPGDPLEDLGYMAWTWCITSRPGAPSADEQADQVRVPVDAYGLPGRARGSLLDAIVDRRARNADWWRAHRGASAARMAREDQIAERIAWSHREHAFTTAHRAALTSALR